ncbi:MAG: AMP-binding protein [Candidatus Gracilibacteria bacterium]|jgi:acyl-coenzyme A synthetase/AMP-(fatty) acid ligase
MDKLLEKIIATCTSANPEALQDLHSFSIRNKAEFWNAATGLFHWEKPHTKLYESAVGAKRWFVGAEIDYFKSLFWGKDLNQEALVVYNKTGKRKSYTFGELQQEIQRLAVVLLDRGMKPGDRLLICIEDRELSLLLNLASLSIGVIFGNVYFRFPNAMVEELAALMNPDFVVYENTGRESLGSCPDFSKLPSLKEVVFVDEIQVVVGKSVSALPDLLSTESTTEFSSFAHKATEPTNILFSSGTTAHPKLFWRGTAGGVLCNMLDALILFCGEGVGAAWIDLDFAWVPTFAWVYPVLSLGQKLVIDKRNFHLGVAYTYEVCEKEKIGAISFPQIFLEAGEANKIPKPYQIKKLSFAGSKLTELMTKECLRFFDLNNLTVINELGSSELGACSFLNPIEGDLLKTDWNLLQPFLGLEYRINPDGRLLFKNEFPSFTPGIINGEERYRKLWSEDFEWFITEDVAREERGRIKILGRADNFIKVKSRMLDIVFLESEVKKITGIREAKLLSLDKEKQVLILFLEADSLDGLRQQVEVAITQNIGSYALPQEIILLEKFPRGAAGKISFSELKECYEKNIIN